MEVHTKSKCEPCFLNQVLVLVYFLDLPSNDCLSRMPSYEILMHEFLSRRDSEVKGQLKQVTFLSHG